MNDQLLISIFISIGILVAFLYEYLARNIGRKYFKINAIVVCGYKLHHSLYGLLGLLLSFWFFYEGNIFSGEIFLGLSFGVIIQHTIADGFKFITKETKTN